MPLRCTRCERLPDELPETGTLYVSTCLGHALGLLRRHLDESDMPFTEPFPNVLAVALRPGSLGLLAVTLPGVLTGAELRDARSLVLAEGVEPSLAELMHMRPLSALVALLQGQWLVEALRERRLLTWFHPIVHAHEPAEVFAHECLLRARDTDGGLIYPNRLFAAARSADLLFHLDRLARLTAIHTAVEHGLRTHVFVNFNPSSIYNPAACLQSTLRAVRDSELRHDRLVFEVVESDHVADTDHLLTVLKFYRDAGFKVALDDLGAGYNSLNLLTRLRPDFVKLDLELIRGVDRDPYKAQVAAKLLEMAQALGIATVAEGVETEGEWHWARDHGADYVQGFLFARPACPPPQPRVPGSAAVPVRN